MMNNILDEQVQATASAQPEKRDICAVILAAGLGSRLKENTREIPKCLVRVAGVPILERMIAALRLQGITSIVIAVGYLNSAIREYVRSSHPDLEVRIVENPDFAITGSVFSLDLALAAVPDNQDVLIIEGDVVLEVSLLTRLLNAAKLSANAATLLAPYEPSLSGTFALVDGDIVTEWLHESVRKSDFPLVQSYKTVNLTLVKKGNALNQLREAIRGVISKFGVKAPLEYAMQDLVIGGMQIAAVNTLGMRWFEVDTPDDLSIANAMFEEQACG